jgi:hypothetical protein
MYESTSDINPRLKIISRWLWLAVPDDCAQEVRLTYVEYPSLTQRAREELVRDRLRILARDIWRREIVRRPRCRTRHSKLLRATGYRTDAQRKRTVRMELDSMERVRIAALGGIARNGKY